MAIFLSLTLWRLRYKKLLVPQLISHTGRSFLKATGINKNTDFRAFFINSPSGDIIYSLVVKGLRGYQRKFVCIYTLYYVLFDLFQGGAAWFAADGAAEQLTTAISSGYGTRRGRREAATCSKDRGQDFEFMPPKAERREHWLDSSPNV